jgi:hypothetical protein
MMPHGYNLDLTYPARVRYVFWSAPSACRSPLVPFGCPRSNANSVIVWRFCYTVCSGDAGYDPSHKFQYLLPYSLLVAVPIL